MKYQKENSSSIEELPTIFDADLIEKFDEIQPEVVTIRGETRDIGYNPQACEVKNWDRLVDACHCCLVKYFGRGGRHFLDETETICKDNAICSAENISRIKESHENSDGISYLEKMYESTSVIPKIIPKKGFYDNPFLDEKKTRDLLVEAHSGKKIQIDDFYDEACIQVKNIKELGGFNTESLFSVTTTCNKEIGEQHYIVKESKDAEDEVVALEKIAHFLPLSSIISPNKKANFPLISLPLAYISYPTLEHGYNVFHTLSIQVKASGDNFCSFIQEQGKKLPDSYEEIGRAYINLGLQLANFHLLNMDKSNSDTVLTKTVIHGDLKCANLFYIRETAEFTLIDNPSMERSFFMKKKSPILDIANILLGHLAIGEDEKIRHFLDQIETNSWYKNSISNFLVGYSSAFQPSQKKEVMKDLQALFNSGFSGNGEVMYDETELKNVLLLYINPMFDSFFSKEENLISELESKIQPKGNSKKERHYPSPQFWGDQAIYSVMVDRFRNGDRSNDTKNISENQKFEEKQRDFSTIGKHRHGGDIQGIIDRLDYIVDLGVSTLMVTSIFENNNSAYHGYCVSDFTKVDPNFGTNEDFTHLVQEAHKRGLYVILDIVVNHMCDLHSKYLNRIKPDDHVNCSNDLSIEEGKNKKMYSKYSSALDFSPNFQKFFKNQDYFNRCGENTIEETESERPVSFYGDFASGMFDFNTTNYALQKILSDIMANWIKISDVDGFRLDAVKHVSPTFTAYFSTKIREFASHLGKDNFGVFGEIAGTSKLVALHLGKMEGGRSKRFDDEVKRVYKRETKSLDQISHEGKNFPFLGLNGVYEFGHSGNAVKVLQNSRSPETLYSYFEKEEYRRDLQREADLRNSMIQLEIHDWPRFGAYSPTDPYKSRLGLQYLAVAEGLPLLYYGQEQGFTGICPNIQNISSKEGQDILLESCRKSSEVTAHDYKPVLHDEFYRQDMFEEGV